MSRKFLTNLDLAQNQLENARVQNLGAAPSSPVAGQMYYNSGNNTLFWWDGTTWQSAKGGSGSPTGAAGGDLGGTYPNPTVLKAQAGFTVGGTAVALTNDARLSDTRTPTDNSVTTAKIVDGTIVAADVNALNIDGADATPSMRTLGLTGGKAMPGRYDLSTIAAANPTIGNIDMGGNFLKGLSTSPPLAATDAASKGYVDSVASGLDAKASCRLATTADVGGTFNPTGGAGGVAQLRNPGGFAGLESAWAGGDRILVKNQTASFQNGIYVVTGGGVTMDRTSDADAWTELVSAFVFVEEGTINKDTGWVCTADANGTLNTTALPWAQFSGAGSITAGTGLTQTGNTINVGAGVGIVANADDVAVNYAGSSGDLGSANTVARGDHAHSALYPPVGRTISTTGALTGGGDLSANRTLGVNTYAGGANVGVVPTGGTAATFLKGDGTWGSAGGSGTVKSIAQGCSAGTQTVINHSFATRDVMVRMYRNSAPYDEVECDVEHTDTSNVTVRTAAATTSGEYRIVVMG